MDRLPPMNRRQFLAATIAAAIAAACSDDDDTSSGQSTTSGPGESTTTATPDTTTTASEPAVELPGDPFYLGVASGDPTAESVILWTRLAYPPADGIGLPGADIPVDWEVASDDAFGTVVASGTAAATAALGYSLHVDATGLEPDGTYFYRFATAGYTSPVGRTRTFAAAGSSPDQFRFAVSSCQNWQAGHYAAWRDVATLEELDAVVFLGDYIYEYADGAYEQDGGRPLDGSAEVASLDDYRARYAFYKTDTNLQAAHAAAPWIVTWDDHEVDNDYAGDISEENTPVEDFRARRAAAYQAWYEHMPVRLDAPDGPDWPIYRAVSSGDLVSFYVLDTRQYRSDQPSEGATLDIPAVGDAVRQIDPATLTDQSMLGDDQEAWLVDAASSSGSAWNVLAQQVFMFGASVLPGQSPPYVVVDTWDGYSVARRRLFESLTANAVPNIVVLTGDFHSGAVADVRLDPFDPAGAAVATEFMAPSISSGFFDGAEDLAGAALAANTQVKFFTARNGYTLCTVTADTWTSEYRAVADRGDPDSPVETISTWEVTAGTPGAVEVV